MVGMAAETDRPKRSLPKGFFRLEVLSNVPEPEMEDREIPDVDIDWDES